MKKNLSQYVVLSALIALPACSESGSATANLPAPTHAEALSLDDALANLDTGRDVAASRALIEAKLAQKEIGTETRAQATMALARVALAEGDRERGVKLLEDASALGDHEAEKKLFALLSGHEPPSPWLRRAVEQAPVSPFAHALAKYFPRPAGEGAVEIDLVSIGGVGSRTTADSLGTFAVDEVLREDAQAVCGFCDEPKGNTHMTSSRETSWSAIPRYASRLEKALVVVYVDRETILHERYARWLAMPLEEVREAIAQERGVYAVKERASAPPLVTIVAPRPSQFLTVEAALAARSDVPIAPTSVKLAPGLAPREVQQAVRARFSAFRKCYETLLATRKTASGKAVASFSIDPKGTVEDVQLELVGTLEDPEMRACMVRGFEGIKFPAYRREGTKNVTVTYPVELTP